MYKFELATQELSDIQTLALATELKTMLAKSSYLIKTFLYDYDLGKIEGKILLTLHKHAEDSAQLLELINAKTC